MRIVSFLPSATEMVYRLGLEDQLVGVTHECDYPEAAKAKAVVIRNAIDLEKMNLGEIDRAVAERMHQGASLYRVDERLLEKLGPDLILTQDLCQVCAPSGNEVSQTLKSLTKQPAILWMTPRSLAEIHQNLRELGQATGRSAEAEQSIAADRARLDKIAAVTKRLPKRPRVFFMEWTDPLYCAGHWVPEMIEIAGGSDQLARKGADSVRIAWEKILEWNPEVLIVSPCGFHLEQSAEQAAKLSALPGYATLAAVQQGNVFAVDASSYFARPGPRVVDGAEILAHLIHPEHFTWNGDHAAFRRMGKSA